MSPIVSIVGKSKSGKTTLIEKLIQELKSRGYRVATMKHVPRGVGFDNPDKDNWRHIQAGSEATAITSPDKIVLIKPVVQEATIDEVARLLGEDYGIILAEGFKQGGTPKIEVHRKDAGPPLEGVKKLIAVVTDEPLNTKVRQFSTQEIGDIADLLEKGFIKPQKERASLYVNDTPVTLTEFPRHIIGNVVLAMASCLRGVEEIKSIKLFLRKE